MPACPNGSHASTLLTWMTLFWPPKVIFSVGSSLPATLRVEWSSCSPHEVSSFMAAALEERLLRNFWKVTSLCAGGTRV